MAEKKQTEERNHNFVDYLAWRGDLFFSQSAFCEVDNLVLSMVCYLNYEGIVPAGFSSPVSLHEAVERFYRRPEAERQMGTVIPNEIPDLARQTAGSRRFAGTQVFGFINDINENEQMQFCAMSYLLPDNSMFIAFRGTDDTIIGWKEDFMLAFSTPVPAQKRAVEYLNAISAAYPDKKIRLGGHSKGGNLAVYATIYAKPEVQARVEVAYSNDGPGFMPEVLQEPAYSAVENKLITFVPQSSVVGVLLHHAGKFKIIRSTQKNVLQHDPYSWVVLGSKFVYEKSRSSFGARADSTLDKWIDGMSKPERKRFTENLFSLITASGAKTISDIVSDKVKSVRGIIASFTKMEKKDRDLMFNILHKLLRASRESNKIEENQKQRLKAEKLTKMKKLPLKKEKLKKEKLKKEHPNGSDDELSAAQKA